MHWVQDKKWMRGAPIQGFSRSATVEWTREAPNQGFSVSEVIEWTEGAPNEGMPKQVQSCEADRRSTQEGFSGAVCVGPMTPSTVRGLDSNNGLVNAAAKKKKWAHPADQPKKKVGDGMELLWCMHCNGGKSLWNRNHGSANHSED